VGDVQVGKLLTLHCFSDGAVWVGVDRRADHGEGIHVFWNWIVAIDLFGEAGPRAHNPWVSEIITTSVLIAGFTMRYIVIYAGQMAQVISS